MSPTPSPPSSESSLPLEGEESGRGAWRSVLAGRLAVVAFVGNAVGTPLAVLMVSGEGRLEVALGGTVAGGLLLLALRRRTPPRVRSALLVGGFVTATLAGYASVGFLGGPGAGLVVAVIVSALLLGSRAMTMVLGASVLAIATIGWAVVSGRLPAPPPQDMSPLAPTVWIRTAGIASMFAGVGGAIVIWVVARMEQSLARVRHEASRRRAAEVARREAEHIAVQSQKLELIGRLAAGLAHDFNNHLTVIAMAHGRLADERVDADARRDASRAIQESIRSAGALARQLLVLGRRAPRNLVDVALAEIVDGFLPSLERVLPSDVRLEVVHQGDAVVRADETQLQQALLNFVVNARDAMPDGGRLVVRTRGVVISEARQLRRTELRPGRWALLEVEDDGTGIDSSIQDQVFDPFFTTKPLDEGSGLGLSTVAMMAEEAGGHVELDSAVGRGTRIALWLPASAARARDATPTSTPIPSTASLIGRVALVVEDEPLLLDAAVRVLADAGCRVLSAPDGTAAMKVMADHDGTIDLLCTDVVMPGVPVRDVISRFRELHPTSPVLTCSGYVGEDLVRRGIEEGRYRLLEKPYTADDLLDAVTALLRSSSARHRAAG